MEAIFTHHSPQNCSTIRPFQNTIMWGPHEKKKGADRRALLGPVVCHAMIPRGVYIPLRTMVCPLHAMPSTLEARDDSQGGLHPPTNHRVPSTLV